jgi:hypothetical protein
MIDSRRRNQFPTHNAILVSAVPFGILVHYLSRSVLRKAAALGQLCCYPRLGFQSVVISICNSALHARRKFATRAKRVTPNLPLCSSLRYYHGCLSLPLLGRECSTHLGYPRSTITCSFAVSLGIICPAFSLLLEALETVLGESMNYPSDPRLRSKGFTIPEKHFGSLSHLSHPRFVPWPNFRRVSSVSSVTKSRSRPLIRMGAMPRGIPKPLGVNCLKFRRDCKSDIGAESSNVRDAVGAKFE